MIAKKCLNPKCTFEELDLLGAIIINKKSFNYYKCPKCKQNFNVKRTKDEQILTQKFIDASKIILIKK